MPSEVADRENRGTLGQWIPYLAKSIVLVAVLYLAVRFVPAMPPAGVALCWAVLSSVLAVGLVYQAVIRKARNQHMYRPGQLLSRVNSGRFLSIILAFVAAAICVAGLLLEASRWGVSQWAVVCLAIPAYIAVFAIARKRLATQYEPPYQASRAMLISSFLVCALLCVAYLLINLAQPAAVYANLTEAYVATQQPFAQAPSALLAEGGKLIALVDAVTAYGMAKAAEVSFGAYLAWRVVVCVAAFFGIASLLGTCALSGVELKLAFQPLDAVREPEAGHPIAGGYVAAVVAMAVLMAVGYLAADAKVAEVAQTEDYTAAESFVRDQVGLAAYVIDGKYYEDQKARTAIDALGARSDELAAEREKAMTPLINEAFDKRVANVDAYLDWYYSLPADYERLARFFAGTVEDGMREQLKEQLEQGIDDSEFSEKMAYYQERSQELVDDLNAALADAEITGIPEWLVVPTETLAAGELPGPLAPTQKFLDAGERMGVSAGIGAVTSVVATKIVQRIVEKSFFKKIVAELSGKLAMNGLLAAGGTLVAPGVGTAIGVGVGVATDYLFLKADEAMNRESYKEELVNSLEESRRAMLDMVSAS